MILLWKCPDDLMWCAMTSANGETFCRDGFNYEHQAHDAANVWLREKLNP